jgi:hypothetical protein
MCGHDQSLAVKPYNKTKKAAYPSLIDRCRDLVVYYTTITLILVSWVQSLLTNSNFVPPWLTFSHDHLQLTYKSKPSLHFDPHIPQQSSLNTLTHTDNPKLGLI